MSPAALRQLVALAEARRARALALLEAAAAEDRRLEGEEAALERARAEDAASTHAALPLAHLGLRAAWAEAERTRLQVRRAALAADIARLRRSAAALVGRHAALEAIAGRAETSAALRRDARREREAPPPGPPRP